MSENVGAKTPAVKQGLHGHSTAETHPSSAKTVDVYGT